MDPARLVKSVRKLDSCKTPPYAPPKCAPVRCAFSSQHLPLGRSGIEGLPDGANVAVPFAELWGRSLLLSGHRCVMRLRDYPVPFLRAWDLK